MKKQHKTRIKFSRFVAGLALTSLLAACTVTQDGLTADGGQAGYISGDGTVTTWAPDERGEAIEFTATTYNDQTVELPLQDGRFTVLNTWYDTCPPCRLEAPDLAEVANEYADDVFFLGINRVNSPETAQAFEEQFDIPYDTVDDREGKVSAALQGVVSMQAVPTTLVLDDQGRVAGRIIGATTAITLKTIIADLQDETA